MQKTRIFQTEQFYFWLTLFFLLVQGVLIALTTVNIPVADEWESLRPDALPGGFSLEYLFAFHNEHRIVFTKLLNYMFFYTTDWNLKYLVIANYFIFSSLVFFVIWFQKKAIPNATKGIWILPFFLTSPLVIENHTWGIQSVFHFCILFGSLSVYNATRKRISKSDYWSAGVFSLFSMYSLAAGLFFTMITFLILLYRMTVFPKINWADASSKALALLAVASGVLLWFVGLSRPERHPPYTWPYQAKYWSFFSNLVSLGFGYKTESMIIAFLAVGLVGFILWKSLGKAFAFESQYVSFGFFGALAVLGAFASIALSRADFGIGQAKTSRYAELGFMLVPFIGWLCWDLTKESQKYQKAFRIFMWFVVSGFAGSYSYSTYFNIAKERKQGLACITRFYNRENTTGDCPILYPGPLSERLERAKKLGLSWVPEN